MFDAIGAHYLLVVLGGMTAFAAALLSVTISDRRLPPERPLR